MKRACVAILTIFIAISVVAVASAVPVKITYTADNLVNAWYQNGASPTALPLGDNKADWQKVDSYTLDLNICEEYQIIWQDINSDKNQNMLNNPGGFLAEIETQYLPANIKPSSALWEVYVQYGSHAVPGDFNVLSWQSATMYAYNKDNGAIPPHPSLYGTDSIWWHVNGDNPVSGISGNAAWIWGPANFNNNDINGNPPPGPNDSVFIRVKVHPTPEPGTLLLIGSGLAGLAGYGKLRLRRRKR